MLSTDELIILYCCGGEDSWESLGQQGDQTSQIQRKSTLNIHWKAYCWRWRSNTLATWCEKPTHWKRLYAGKNIALTRRTFVGKVMSLLFNRLSRFVIAFPPGSKRLLIPWLQSLSAVILEPKKIKSVTVFSFSPSIYHEVMGPDAMILILWMLSFKLAFLLSSFTKYIYFFVFFSSGM